MCNDDGDISNNNNKNTKPSIRSNNNNNKVNLSFGSEKVKYVHL
jgi:hypothetical protein